jgi:PHD/YefM family antitoxin component YafN of YafNO toxin-antitoxin module
MNLLKTLSVTDLKKEFRQATGKVEHGQVRLVIERNNKAAFALIPIEDLELLQRVEDLIDAQAAEASMKDPRRSIPWEELKAKLGL